MVWFVSRVPVLLGVSCLLSVLAVRSAQACDPVLEPQLYDVTPAFNELPPPADGGSSARSKIPIDGIFLIEVTRADLLSHDQVHFSLVPASQPAVSGSLRTHPLGALWVSDAPLAADTEYTIDASLGDPPHDPNSRKTFHSVELTSDSAADPLPAPIITSFSVVESDAELPGDCAPGSEVDSCNNCLTHEVAGHEYQRRWSFTINDTTHVYNWIQTFSTRTGTSPADLENKAFTEWTPPASYNRTWTLIEHATGNDQGSQRCAQVQAIDPRDGKATASQVVCATVTAGQPVLVNPEPQTFPSLGNDTRSPGNDTRSPTRGGCAAAPPNTEDAGSLLGWLCWTLLCVSLANRRRNAAAKY